MNRRGFLRFLGLAAGAPIAVAGVSALPVGAERAEGVSPSADNAVARAAMAGMRRSRFVPVVGDVVAFRGRKWVVTATRLGRGTSRLSKF